jgi:hypothetical protein
VHGLLADIETGRMEWIVNGYQTLESRAGRPGTPASLIGQATEKLGQFNMGEMKFPEAKIGELAAQAQDWLKQKQAQTVEKVEQIGAKSGDELAKLAANAAAYAEKHWPQPPTVPPKIPVPPPIRVHVTKPRR